MAKSNKYEIDYFGSDGEKKPKKKKSNNNKIFLIVSACVLVAALIVFMVTLMSNQQTSERIVDFGTAIKGVTVEGIDISGMTKEQALAATASLEQKKLSAVKFTLSVNNQNHEYGASDLSVISDYQDVINKAMDYGHTGDFDQREADAEKAIKGMNFTITLSVNESTFQASLDNIKASLEVAAKDATAQFMPWGYTQNADGTIKQYNPDLTTIKAIVEAEAHGKEYTGDADYTNRVRLQDTDMPNTYRYEYYQNSKFIAGYDQKTDKFLTGYRPTNASIARFYYTPEVEGLTVDMNSVADQIKSEVQNGKYDPITVQSQPVDPAVKLADLKKNTQLITSWTSSFSKSTHYNTPRNWNVAMISALINNGGSAPTGQAGSVIMPGQQWSVNTTVGPRNASTAAKIGWQKAAGIENGGYTPQYGGGVCQLGSTTYNAAIRAQSDNGLKVTSFTHHTIPSDYEPAGLDATLSTPAPDLVLGNDGTTPYYVVSYVNPTEKDVTVEIYGPSLTDPATGQDVIHTFKSENTGSYGPTPVSNTIPEAGPDPFQCPDGTMIGTYDANGIFVTQYQYAQDRQGCKAEIWQLVYTLDGTQLSAPTVYDNEVDYNTINGTLYVWTGPTPTPTPSPTNTTSPTDTTGDGTT